MLSLRRARFAAWPAARSGVLAVGVLAAWMHPAAADESPQAIVDHMRAVYADLPSYADSGTVLKELGSNSHDEHHFATRFKRAPRHFLFDMHKQNDDRLVVWGDPDAFHTWWKTTRQTMDYPNPRNTGAISLSDYPTVGAISKIPVLLYAKAAMNGALARFEPASLDATESLMGHPCFRLSGNTSDLYAESGKQVNVRKLTVWIDAKSYLVRRVVEEAPAAPGMLDRTTTTFDPTADPTLADDAFAFTPPK